MRRKLLALMLLTTSLACVGCGSSNEVWITGTLLKGGTKFTPPEGHQVGITFYLVSTDDPTKSAAAAGEPYLADYDESDGTFKVPGRNGQGIPPGKYRISVSDKLDREAFDKLPKAKTKAIKRGAVPAINRETDFLDSRFGSGTSPIVRNFKASENVTVDLDKPE